MQVLFVTVDPERDTPDLLSKYVPAFDPRFVGLYGDADATARTAKEFKVIYQKQPGATPGTYTMDHSAGTFIFDPSGKLRGVRRATGRGPTCSRTTCGNCCGRQRLGPVHAMDANANGRHGAPVKAHDEDGRRAGGSRMAPCGPLRVAAKTPITALRSLAGCPTRLRLRAWCGRFGGNAYVPIV